MAYIDTSKITIPKGFFEDLNTPKLLDWLNSQPTADVEEVRHGEWIKNKPNPEIMKKFHDMGIGTAMSVNSIHWTCSCCGTWGVPRYNYCTRCGAKMDGGKNETRE